MPTSIPNKRDLLARNFLFSPLQPDELDRILEFSRERSFLHGQIIFQKGDSGDSVFAVLAGSVRISANSDDGKEIVLNIIETGNMFGEIALIDGGKRSATATAIGDCTLLVIRRSEFIPFLKQSPEIAIQLLAILCQKLRDTSDRVETVGLLPVPVRLARFLLRLGEVKGQETATGLLLDMKLSQGEIGNQIGAVRESVNKQLRAWQKIGLVKLGGQNRCVTLVDTNALEEIASGSMW